MADSLPMMGLQILQIIWLDLLLSGDNAVVIALACRDLPERRRKLGVMLGAAAAVGLRILFTVLLVYLLQLPYLKLVGGVLLLGIAIKLAIDDSGHDPGEVKAKPNLWGAVSTIMIADGVMSLDNVLAIVGVADGHIGLIVFGLLLSIPLVVFGAGFVMRMIDRWPLLIWAGAALLGWVAGEMLTEDSLVESWLHRIGDPPDAAVSAVFAALVIAIAGLLKLRRRKPG